MSPSNGERREAAPTRGEQMLALRKKRMAATHPFLRGGFRPFFFGAAAWAIIAIGLWLCELAGEIGLPTGFEAVAWHRHEMLFGFVGAAVTGFLLTAIPNWTGRLPIAGRPLLSLFGLWAAARLAVLFSATIGLWPAAIVDVGLFMSLAVLCRPGSHRQQEPEHASRWPGAPLRDRGRGRLWRGGRRDFGRTWLARGDCAC